MSEAEPAKTLKRKSEWIVLGRFRHVQTGAFSLPPFGAIDFVAKVEDKTNWTPVIGGEFYLNRHWSFMAELGLGADQTQGMTGVTYRF